MAFSPEKFMPPPESVPDSSGERVEGGREDETSPDFSAEIRRDAESARKGIAQAVWSEPARFAVAMSRGTAGEMKRFLEKFIGQETTFSSPTLKRACEVVRAAVEPK